MLIRQIKDKILNNAISLTQLGINDLAWEKKDALRLIETLMQDEIAILGGDVYKVEGKKITPTYDSWYCDRVPSEKPEKYNTRSKLKALDYIKNYPEKEQKILFSLVFSEYVDPYEQEE